MSPRRLAIPLALLLLLPLAAARETPPDQVDGGRALGFVKVLASDAFAGRKSGLASGRNAEEWVAARIREFGLLPGNGESFFHGLTATVTEELPTPALVATTNGEKPREAKYLEDYVALSYSGEGAVDAGVVFAGYGIAEPDRGRDDYAGLDVRGKIVMALRGKPPGSDFEEERQIGYKSSTAFDRGAVGFLLVEGDRAISGTIQEKFFREKLPAVWLSRKTADDLFARAGRPPLAREVETLAAGKPASFPLENVRVRLEIHCRVHRDAPMRNVVGLWPGETDEVVVLGAHLDHLGVDGAGNVLNGADDNGSGSAMLLEVARAVAAAGRKYRRGILFAWFAGEEQGLLGSRAFVAKPPVPLEKIAVMLNTDMVGQGRPQLAVSGLGVYPRAAAFLGNFDLPGVDVRRGWQGGGGSDHASFQRAGVPAFFIHTTGPHPNYHSPADDWPAIRPGLLQLAGRFVRAMAERAAASEAPFCRPNRRAEYLWHAAPVCDLSSRAAVPAPREMGIDLRIRWTDGDLNGIDAVLTGLEAKDAAETLIRPGADPGPALRGRKPAVLLGVRGAAAARLCRPLHRLGVTVFDPDIGEVVATDPGELLDLASARPAIVDLRGAPEALDPGTIDAPILLSAEQARPFRETLAARKAPWLVVCRLAPLIENKPAGHAEVARAILDLRKEFGTEHLLVTPGDPADPTYAAQAPTLHPGIVAGLLEGGASDEDVRNLLGGNFVRMLGGLRKR